MAVFARLFGVLAVSAVIMITVWSVPADAQEHPFAGSVAVPLLLGGESPAWNRVAMGPGGNELYVSSVFEGVVSVDLEDLQVTTSNLLSSDALHHMRFSPDGRLFVLTSAELLEVDPTSLEVVDTLSGLWSSSADFVLSPDGNRIYVSAISDVYVINVSGGTMQAIDTVAGGDVDGLAAANPGWDWHRARRLGVSPDGNTLWVTGADDWTPGYKPMQTIRGMTAENWTQLEFQVQEWPSPTENRATTGGFVFLSGNRMVDGQCNVWDTATLAPTGTLSITSEIDSLDCELIAESPDGEHLFLWVFASLSGGPGQMTDGGEQLAVIDRDTLDVIDLDDNPGNGTTGIDLDVAGGSNYKDLAFTPDGTRIYAATGRDEARFIPLIGGGFDVNPKRGGNDGEITTVLSGPTEMPAEVRLERDGYDDIVAHYIETGETATEWEVRFDLEGAAIGAWDVVLEDSQGQQSRFSQGFFVEAVRLSAGFDATGTSSLRSDEVATLFLTVHNTSNVDALDLVVSIQLPQDVDYKVVLPSRVEGGATQVDEEWITPTPGIPERIWLPRLEAGRSYDFDIDVLPTRPWDSIDDGVNFEVEVGFLGPRELPNGSLLGDGCGLADAAIKAVQDKADELGEDASPEEISDAIDDAMLNAAEDFGASKLTSFITATVLTLTLGPVGAAIALALDIGGDITSCFSLLKRILGLKGILSLDPNEKSSNSGLDGFVMPHDKLVYTILFENLPEATAEARLVEITDELDPSLDPSTVQLIKTSHPDLLELVEDEGTMVFRFEDIDLPPNTSPPEGEGFIIFSVEMRDDMELTSGTEIRNQASIVFDNNPPIETGTVVHTIDTDPPAASLEALQPAVDCDPLTLTWTAEDTGVGVDSVNLWVSRDQGPLEPLAIDVEGESYDFWGVENQVVSFALTARDRLGNETSRPTDGDVSTVCQTGGTPPDSMEADVLEPGTGGGGGCCSTVSQPTRRMPWIPVGMLLLFGAVALVRTTKRR